MGSIDGWQPIETFQRNEKSDYSFALVAYGPEDDRSIGKAMRYKDEWFVGALFYNMAAKHGERQFYFREHKINPTLWMAIPELPE